MRKLFFWLHLSAGVVVGLIIFIMSVTGVLLMYEKQMVAWFDYRSLPPVQVGSRLSVDKLLTLANEARGSMPSSIAMSQDPMLPAQLLFGRETIYQDPYTGKILGKGNAGVRSFFRSVTDWHRWLAARSENRGPARAITGYSNLLFLFIVLSGSYLWIPRIWTKATVKAITLFRGGLSGKARDFNWHNVIGIWSLIPLIFIVASGCVISFPWASNLVFTLTGTPQPGQPERRSESAGPRNEQNNRITGRDVDSDLNLTGLDALWTRVAKESPKDWRLLTMRVPVVDRAPVVFVVDEGYAGQPQKRTTLSLDRETREIKSKEVYSNLNAGRKARTWLRFVHTGEFYGLPGQTIAGVASAGGALLTFTGIALSIRRLSAWRARRTRAAQSEVESPLSA